MAPFDRVSIEDTQAVVKEISSRLRLSDVSESEMKDIALFSLQFSFDNILR